MKQQLEILFVNNTNEDIQKMVQELEREGYQVVTQRVGSFAGLKEALHSKTWDLLVSDCSSGYINPNLIAQTVRASVEDLPYIVYSRDYDENEAIAALNAGARDYFANGSYKRLVPIMERELFEAHNRQERKRSEKVQASLLKFAQTVLTVQNLEQLYALIHAIIGELMPAENFYIALYDPETDLVHYPYYVDQYDQNPLPEKPGKGLTAYVLRTGESLLASPQVFDELVTRGEVELLGAPSIDWLGVPLKTGDVTIGVFVVQSYTEGIRFTQEHADILAFFSTHVAIAIERKRAEEALRTEYTFRKAIEASMMAGIFVIDLEQRINYINPAFCRMLGWSEGELFGTKPPYLFWPPEEIEAILEAYQVTTGEDALPSDFELKFLRRNGDRFDVLIMVAPLTDQQGKTTGWLSSVYDITQRKKADAALRKSEERYRQAVENSPNPIFSVGRYKTIQMWNQACERVFGYGQGIIGSPYHFLLSDVHDTHSLDEKVDQVFQRQALINLELTFISQEGRKLFVMARIYPVLDSEGNVQSCVFTCTDLTDRIEGGETPV
jgi:PAS domain S-box-containing protein